MKIFLVDLAERAVATYIETLIGLLLLANVLDVSALKVAAVSALPAALAVLKGGVASRFGTLGSASAAPDVPAPYAARHRAADEPAFDPATAPQGK